MNNHSAALRNQNVFVRGYRINAAEFGRGEKHPMKRIVHRLVSSLAFLLVLVLPAVSQDAQWDFVYNGDQLPQTIIDNGGTDWLAIEGETNGQPDYETLVLSDEAQVGGIWSRRDDNSTPDPDKSAWARGYYFGVNSYAAYTGKMTLVLRIKDLGTGSQKSVIDFHTDFENANDARYFTLGHVVESTDGPAGWEFGQTDDSRNGNGLSDVRTGGYNEWAIIRITVVDEIPGDGRSRLTAWQDGVLVYDSIRGDDLPAGGFGAIGFRRTSGGSEQQMAIDWIRMSFTDAYVPGDGPLTPNGGSDSPGWDFVYNGDVLPETIVQSGGVDWQARSGETNGRPIYESILPSMEAQVGGLWSRRDDNSEDPDAPGASNWARGYLFGTDIYDKWNGRMTLIVRIKDLGTTSQKSVIDFTTADGSNYWTLGHVIESGDGPAGWEFGQTDDSRNGNGESDVRTGGYDKFVVIRIVIIDDVPGDGVSFIKAWQDGQLIYQSERDDSISIGEFGEVAFRRTSGGGEQHMEIDWVLMKFGNAWEPGSGSETPAGLYDGAGANVMNFPRPDLVNGAISLDTLGTIRTVHDPQLGAGANKLFEVDENGVPTQFDIFYLGFDVYRDLEVVANDEDVLTGLIALDKYAGVHTYTVTGPGLVVTGPGMIVSGAANGPKIDYSEGIAEYNAEHPNPFNPEIPLVSLPYFPFDLPTDGDIPVRGAREGVARDLEVAIDWRPATNAFQGYYLLDAYAGVHYVNNPSILAMLALNPGEEGTQKFFDIFGFKNYYREDYGGIDEQGNVLVKEPPYFFFSPDSAIPIARDLEVMVRFEEVTTPMINDSQDRNQLAIDEGIDVDNLFQPIEMSEDRLDYTKPVYTEKVAVTNGYVILDGFGAVFSMIEDEEGNPVPAPWENEETGAIDPSLDSPYFANPPFTDGDDYDIVVDIEILPSGKGYCLLTRLGEVFVINGVGVAPEENFVTPGIEDEFLVFGFDAARNLELVSNEEGKVIGMYVVDRFGTIHTAGDAPALPSEILFFANGYSRDLELSPYSRPVTSPYYVPASVEND